MLWLFKPRVFSSAVIITDGSIGSDPIDPRLVEAWKQQQKDIDWKSRKDIVQKAIDSIEPIVKKPTYKVKKVFEPEIEKTIEKEPDPLSFLKAEEIAANSIEAPLSKPSPTVIKKPEIKPKKEVFHTRLNINGLDYGRKPALPLIEASTVDIPLVLPSQLPVKYGMPINYSPMNMYPAPLETRLTKQDNNLIALAEAQTDEEIALLAVKLLEES